MLKKRFSSQEHKDAMWLLEQSKEWSKKYPDKWVVAYKKKLVGIGNNAEEAEVEARKKVGNKAALIRMFVEGGPYVY